MLAENQDEAENMEKWMRRGLRQRQYARWISRLGHFLNAGGVFGIAVISTVGREDMHARGGRGRGRGACD
jgi:hypothetical protein